MSLRQNPAEKMSQLERDALRWQTLARPCDDPHRNFARIRQSKPKPDGLTAKNAESTKTLIADKRGC